MFGARNFPGVRLAVLDLAPALAAPCAAPEAPGAAASDFERWSPADALEDSDKSRRGP